MIFSTIPVTAQRGRGSLSMFIQSIVCQCFWGPILTHTKDPQWKAFLGAWFEQPKCFSKGDKNPDLDPGKTWTTQKSDGRQRNELRIQPLASLRAHLSCGACACPVRYPQQTQLIQKIGSDGFDVPLPVVAQTSRLTPLHNLHPLWL